MLNRSKLLFVLWLIGWIMVSGCGSQNDRLLVDVSDIHVPHVKIHRYDLELFQVRHDHLSQDLEKLKPEYRFFLETDLSDPTKLEQMQAYLENRRTREFYAEVRTRFKDVANLENSLTDLFRHLKYYYPDVKIPRVYSYISGGDYDFPVQLSDSVLLIGLDNFLGTDFKPYVADGISRYRIARMTPQHIMPGIAGALREEMYPAQFPGNSLLEQMVESGKDIYFIKAMIPNTELRFILGYSKDQYQWITNHEPPVWSAIIDNQMLYSTDGQMTRSWMSDGPFSPGFSQEAPPRLGAFIGWQIVRKFMENQPDVTLSQLMDEKDHQKILTRSKYKPQK